MKSKPKTALLSYVCPGSASCSPGTTKTIAFIVTSVHSSTVVLMNVKENTHTTYYKNTSGLLDVVTNQNKPCIIMYKLSAAPKDQTKPILKSLTDKPINSDLGLESIVLEKDQDVLIQIGPFPSPDELFLWSRPGNAL